MATAAPVERFAAVEDGVELCLEERGEPDAPLLLLISGATGSMDWWEDALCDAFAALGLRVARYDHRDTGASTAWPVGAPGYGSRALADDALALLDALGAARAHLVGISMGGGIAQALAIAHPERVASLVLLATSPVDPAIDGLPGPSDALRAAWTRERPAAADPDDAEAVAAALVEEERPYLPGAGFEPGRLLPVARRVVARRRVPGAELNHLQVIGSDDAPIAPGAIGRLDVPALVVHGAHDPLFPIEHGRALARAIPQAELLELAAMGHGLPPRAEWDALVAGVGRTVARA